MSDGEWHSVRHLYLDLGVTIPPEKAFRSLSQYQRGHYERDPDAWIRRGRMQVLRYLLVDMQCETRGFDWDREWRMVNQQ